MVVQFCTSATLMYQTISLLVQVSLSFYEENKQQTWFSNKSERLYWEQWHINLHVLTSKAHGKSHHSKASAVPRGNLAFCLCMKNMAHRCTSLDILEAFLLCDIRNCTGRERFTPRCLGVCPPWSLVSDHKICWWEEGPYPFYIQLLWGEIIPFWDHHPKVCAFFSSDNHCPEELLIRFHEISHLFGSNKYILWRGFYINLQVTLFPWACSTVHQIPPLVGTRTFSRGCCRLGILPCSADHRNTILCK